MSNQPICSCCGEEVSGLPLDYSMRLPDALRTLSPWKRRYLDMPIRSMLSYKQKEFYVRGLVEIPVHGSDDKLCFGVWAQVSKEDYNRFGEAWLQTEQKFVSEHVFGSLANTFPNDIFPNTLNMNVAICDRPDIAAAFILEPTEHPMAVAQKEGIPVQRVYEIARIMGMGE